MINEVYFEKEKYFSKNKAAVIKAYIQQPIKTSPQKLKSINDKVRRMAMSRQ